MLCLVTSTTVVTVYGKDWVPSRKKGEGKTAENIFELGVSETDEAKESVFPSNTHRSTIDVALGPVGRWPLDQYLRKK